MTKSLLDIQNLTVTYKNNIVLNNINHSIENGESYCVIGKNGAGKSTFLKSIIGLLPITSGKIIFNDIDITKNPIYKRIDLGISYLSQNNNIFPRLTVKEHFELVKNKDEDILEELIPEILKLKKNYAGNLSGGEQRLLGLSLVLLQKNKKIILLDELFAGVDNNIKSRMLEVFEHIQTQEKQTILIVEQDEKIIQKFDGIIINLKNTKNEKIK
ncbi:ATP-binding cassette domain-containing protein [Pontimicrobium sp. MEBiC06410]